MRDHLHKYTALKPKRRGKGHGNADGQNRCATLSRVHFEYIAPRSSPTERRLCSFFLPVRCVQSLQGAWFILLGMSQRPAVLDGRSTYGLHTCFATFYHGILRDAFQRCRPMLSCSPLDLNALSMGAFRDVQGMSVKCRSICSRRPRGRRRFM